MSSSRRRLLAAALALAAPPAAAQFPWSGVAPRLWRPTRILLHLDVSLEERTFLPRLVALLERMFTARTETAEAFLDVEAFRSPVGQVEAERLLGDLRRGFTPKARAGEAHVFLIGADMVLSPWNFAFAAGMNSLADQVGLILVSLARMTSGAGRVDRRPWLTADRAFRMVAKNVVRVAGYYVGGGCLLATPMTLAELSAMQGDFCAEDRRLLEAAGIIRPRG